MEFEWDEAKRKENLRKHGLDFLDAPEIFNGPMLTALDTREDYGEDRWIGVGLTQNRCVVVSFTERDEGRITHIISLRKALTHEQKTFEKILKDRLA